jgi:hypothetical protein
MALSIEQVVSIAVSLYVAATVLPDALTAMATATLTSVSPMLVTIFHSLIPMLALVGIALSFFSYLRGA